MNRRTLLVAGTAACLAAPAAAQPAFDFTAAAAYAAARRGVSLVVLQSGQIVFEDYPNRGARGRGWELASGTKSFTGVIAAAARSCARCSRREKSAAPAGLLVNEQNVITSSCIAWCSVPGRSGGVL